MIIRKMQKALNSTSRLLGDANSVKKGTLGKRLVNRHVKNKPMKRALRSLF